MYHSFLIHSSADGRVGCFHVLAYIYIYFYITFHSHALEKEMATYSSVLAWRISGMGSHRVGHD